MADLHDRWVAERRNEHYYKLAKKLNYRSRASFTTSASGFSSPATPSSTWGRAPADGARWPRSAHGLTARSSASI